MKHFKKLVKYFIMETIDRASNPWCMNIQELYCSFLKNLGYDHFKVTYYKPFRRALLRLLCEIEASEPLRPEENKNVKNDSHSETEVKEVVKSSGVRLSKEMPCSTRRLVFLENLPDDEVHTDTSPHSSQNNVLKPLFPNSDKGQSSKASFDKPSPLSKKPKKPKTDSVVEKSKPKPQINQDAIDSYKKIQKIYKLSTLPFPRKDLNGVEDLERKKEILCKKMEEAGIEGKPTSSKARELAVKLELKRLEY